MPQVRFSMSALRAAYPDRNRSTAEIAAAFGMSKRTLHKIAREQGWPPRPFGQIRCKLTPEKIRPLWNAGLRARDIGLLLGASESAIKSYCLRHGFRREGGSTWRPKITLAEWREIEMAVRWAAEIRRAA